MQSSIVQYLLLEEVFPPVIPPQPAEEIVPKFLQFLIITSPSFSPPISKPHIPPDSYESIILSYIKISASFIQSIIFIFWL